ncbi:AAA family ATPase [Pseudanabaena sp. FACHB-1998]|uniref:AAA family ATPase n=1 Tax=Pseudanabaena sp. FACHB-1998 TaxID=2692858 RepID=UPI00167FF29A|nr:AAA family ATPase [Pseudanabaena sp. FACHB-1998]MBD2175597.1 AAA family ATPase [Pseudanabaena sp. FACHB-1998]
MLTRLKVSGFKNLMDVDIRFSPFTCIAGANGVGKSNLFDAIQFLSALSDRSLIEAARSIREENEKSRKNPDIRSLFHRVGDEYDTEMSFEAEMLIPKQGIDDLGQGAKASSTFLRYTLIVAYRAEQRFPKSLGTLEILKEELVRIKKYDIQENLLFDYSKQWINSWFESQSQRRVPFISTEGEKYDDDRKIKVHQDSGSSGRDEGGSVGTSRKFLAKTLPRTVLSESNALESPTALLAKREMQSWRILQLEPSSLRESDDFMSDTVLGMDGSHLPATLYRLANDIENLNTGESLDDSEQQIYAQVANTLSELIHDVRSVSIDRDEKRQLLTLMVQGRDGTFHPARALSDGTLRFLALAVLNLDHETQGLLCLEEPENGIHPERIPAILKLLQSIATDANEPVDIDNPLRQVIINTHSPAVVLQVPDDSLVIAELKEIVNNHKRYKGVRFSCLNDTWRTKDEATNIVAKGRLLGYLNPVASNEKIDVNNNGGNPKLKSKKRSRVADRDDIQPYITGFTEAILEL